MANGDPVTLSRRDIDEIDGFLNSFARKGSPELQGAIKGLRQDLRDPQVHSEFNIKITDGPEREMASQPGRAVSLLFKPASLLLTSFGLCFSCIIGVRFTRKRITRIRIKRCLCLTLGLLVSGHWSIVRNQYRAAAPPAFSIVQPYSQ